MAEIESASRALSGLFIAEVWRHCPGLELASPRDPLARGSQVSFRFEQAWPAMQALIGAGVIGDVRAPDVLRFGFTPLYLDEEDIRRAAAIMGDVFGRETWRAHLGRERAAVT